MAKLKIAHLASGGTLHDLKVSPTLVNGVNVGGTGGNTSITGQQIQPTVKVGASSATTGSILAQKGAHKFRVWDGSSAGVCTLVNRFTPTANDTMSIQVNTALLGSANVVATGGAQTFTYVNWATANVAGPVTPAAGMTLTGTGITGNVVIDSITTVAGLANANVTISSQTVSAQNFTDVDVSVCAWRISNKFVHDFSDTKYRYHLAAPDATFVQVVSA